MMIHMSSFIFFIEKYIKMFGMSSAIILHGALKDKYLRDTT